MKVKFEVGTEKEHDSPMQGRFSIAEHQNIQTEFQSFLGKGGVGVAGGGASPERQPCHIIACYIGRDEITCYYHCIKH